MTAIGTVQLVAAADGADMADTLRSELAGHARVAPGTLPRSLPEAHKNAVLVFLLTPGLLADSAIRGCATLATGSRFPILTVTAAPDTFDFGTLKDELAPLRRLNAVAWEAGDRPGSEVVTAICRYLGLEPFPRNCRLFISYRRSDGGEVADAIYRHFRGIGFDAFLDTEDQAIEPGEDVQDRIHEAIPEKDFLLLVDSPEAADSPWVREEVNVALSNRVDIYVVRVGDSQGFPRVRELPTLDWGSDIERNLFELERIVRSRLAARRTFDRRVMQTLEHVKRLTPLKMTEQKEPRRLLLTTGDRPEAIRYLLDYEDAPYNLTRLHRLAVGQRQVTISDSVECGLLVHRGRPLTTEEQVAVDWARGDESLHVLALEQVVPFFLS